MLSPLTHLLFQNSLPFRLRFLRTQFVGNCIVIVTEAKRTEKVFVFFFWKPSNIFCCAMTTRAFGKICVYFNWKHVFFLRSTCWSQFQWLISGTRVTFFSSYKKIWDWIPLKDMLFAIKIFHFFMLMIII